MLYHGIQCLRWRIQAIAVMILAALFLRADDFRLQYLGVEPISLHTTLSYISGNTGAHLTATATNRSDTTIRHAKICIVAIGWQKDCLFNLWNTEPWKPGTELTWDVTSSRSVPGGLRHTASITEFESDAPPAITPVSRLQPTAQTSPIAPPGQNVFTCAAGSPFCEPRWRNGAQEKIITAYGLRVVVRMDSPEQHYHSFWITVENGRPTPIDVLPNRFTLRITNPLGPPLSPLPLDKVMAKPSIVRILMEAAIGGLEGWQAAHRASSTTVTGSDGSTVQIDQYANGGGPTAQQLAADRQRAEQDRLAAIARAQRNQTVRDVALLANTIDPRYRTPDGTGAVFFARETKVYRNLIVRIPIGDAVFEFPFDVQ